MKKILFIELCNYTDYPLGGHLSFAIHLSTAMKGDIDLVGIRTDELYPVGAWSECELNGYTYHFFNTENKEPILNKGLVPGRIKSYFCIKKFIKRILSHKDYDIIIVQTPEVLFSIPKRYLPKVCLIMPGVGNPLEISRYKWARGLAGIYDRIFCRYAKFVNVILPAADNQAISEYIERSKGCVKSDKVFHFPTRYDANVFNIQPKEVARKELNISMDELMLITTGRLNWFKGWKFMIDAFKLFYNGHKNSKLYFIGKGEDEQKIRDYAKECRLENQVVMAGVHPLITVAKYLNAADLFVMGSYLEGWSTALVEAIACANPCVVTQFSSAHDLVIDGYNGYVQDERNEVAFAKLLDKGLMLEQSKIEQAAKDAYSMSVQTMREQLNNILHFE